MANKFPVSLMNLGKMPILNQLWLEETLLRTTHQNWCLINRGIPKPSIVLGISGKPEKMCDMDLVNRDNVPLIQRFTGGGTVIVDEGTLFITFIMNKDAVPSINPYPRAIMDWTGQVYSPVFQQLLSPFSQPFAVRENDYVLGDHKIGGNAQSIIKDRWLHHTSFLWSFKEAHMRYLQLPEKRPEYRESRDHSSFLTPLENHLQSSEDLLKCTVESLSSIFEVEVLEDSITKHLIEEELGGMNAMALNCRTKVLV
mmetsp:Transcript_10731/g.13951  ORF Transcript_10731/g.13951 Transcript_10731/m.13951 type:complete len:255 (-) Transcript_10731:18-782(-)